MKILITAILSHRSAIKRLDNLKPFQSTFFNSKVFAVAGARQLSTENGGKESNYTYNEVGIPVPGGILACKIWEPYPTNTTPVSSDIPPVICLHGWLDNASTFDLTIPLLKMPSTKLCCLDLPGHGLTTYCSEWWYDAHIEGVLAVKRVAEHFGWKKFSIFGHSLGGIIGFLYTAYFPDEIYKFIAIENMRPLPIPISDVEMLRSCLNLVFEVEKRMKRERKLFKYEQLLEKLYKGRLETISKDGCKALMTRGACEVEPDQYEFSHNSRTLICGQEGRTSAEMSIRLANEVTCPVCFIKADPGNVYEPTERAEEFLNVFRKNLGSKFESYKVPGTHHVHLNEPELIAPIVSNFLSS